MMKAVLKDLKISFKIEFTSPVLKTNATYYDKNTNLITLYNIDFSEFLNKNNKDKFNALKRNKNNLNSIFNNSNLHSIFETKNNITIEF